MKHVEFSLILPCFNEAEHFSKSAERIVGVLRRSGRSFEIIFVDDQSHDQTWQLIKQFIKTYTDVDLRAIRHPRNTGRGQTVADGIVAARANTVGFIDIDCEVSPEYIPQFVDKVQSGWDLVCGDRHYDISPSGLLRATSSEFYSFLVRLLLTTQMADTEAGYKFFARKKILPILSHIKDRGWFWDTEVMIRSERDGLKIAFIPVKFERRHDKTSTVDLWSDTIKYLYNLWRFKQELKLEAETRGRELTQDVRNFWEKKSAAFSNQYKKLMGIPVSPVGLFLELRYAAIKKILSKLPGKSFLDVGCGSGVFLYEALLQGRTVIGIDYSEQMLQQAQKNLSKFSKNKYKLLVGNAVKLPVISNSIDILLASGLTDYLKLEEVEVFMKEVKRVVKRGSHVIITWPKKDSPLRFLRESWGLALRKKFLRLPPMATSYSKEEVELFLDYAGITLLSWQEILWTMRIVLGVKQ